ncbi:hypothetical protein GS894_23555 [Rhodococcus hoagii]|nr:hypothetical protein [Prescottella equi]
MTSKLEHRIDCPRHVPRTGRVSDLHWLRGVAVVAQVLQYKLSKRPSTKTCLDRELAISPRVAAARTASSWMYGVPDSAAARTLRRIASAMSISSSNRRLMSESSNSTRLRFLPATKA